MKPLRVLTIGHSYVIRLNRSIARRTAEDPSLEVTIAAPRFFQGDLRPLDLEEDPGAPYRLVGLPARMTRHIHVYQYGGLGDLIRPGAFDVVHAWVEPYIVAGWQVARATMRGKARYLFRTAQSLSKRFPPPFSAIERYCVGHASGWVAGGGLVYENLVRRGYPADTGRVITLAVDENEFYPDDASGQATRRELGLLDGPIIGFVGRLDASKGLDILMNALEGVLGRWNLLALGSGPYRETLEHWAAARGWSDRVRVHLAKHDEVPRYLRAMDMMVAPSQTMPNWKEQFGRMLIEAFACKVPVIGSDSGEIPFVIDQAGLVVGEKDVEGWTTAIAGLLESPGRRRELAEAGLARCHERYTATSVARQYVELYHTLASTVPTPST